MREHPSYRRVFQIFARNSLIREMMFRANFLIQCVSATSWTLMNIGFYIIVFQHTDAIGKNTGWQQHEFFVFLGTTWIINSMVQTFFMPNVQDFSELIRTGNLDFALVKPIDTQFLVSFQRMEWASLSNFALGLVLLIVSLVHLTSRPDRPWELEPIMFVLYPFYLLCGTAMLYSVMIALAATSIWLGRNQSLYSFWFYITNFSRYPMEIYQRSWGWALWVIFTFIIPVLLVVNVPARLLAQPLHPRQNWEWWLAAFALLATIVALVVSRRIFRRALLSYRSASS